MIIQTVNGKVYSPGEVYTFLKDCEHNKINFLDYSRKSGKTTDLIVFSIEKAVTKPNSLIYILNPGSMFSHEKAVVNLLELNNILFTKEANTISLYNGSKILIVSNIPRGSYPNYIFVDEPDLFEFCDIVNILQQVEILYSKYDILFAGVGSFNYGHIKLLHKMNSRNHLFIYNELNTYSPTNYGKLILSMDQYEQLRSEQGRYPMGII